MSEGDNSTLSVGLLATIVTICAAVGGSAFVVGQTSGKFSQVEQLYQTQLSELQKEKERAIQDIKKESSKKFDIQSGVWKPNNDLDLRDSLEKPGNLSKAWNIKFSNKFSKTPVVRVGISRLGFVGDQFGINVVPHSITSDGFVIDVRKEMNGKLRDLNVFWVAYIE